MSDNCSTGYLPADKILQACQNSLEAVYAARAKKKQDLIVKARRSIFAWFYRNKTDEQIWNSEDIINGYSKMFADILWRRTENTATYLKKLAELAMKNGETKINVCAEDLSYISKYWPKD